MSDDINLDRIAERLVTDGIAAYVEQTGGGCATIMVGEHAADAKGDPRYQAVVGPGWFEGPGWTNARAALDELYIGPDDDGDSYDAVYATKNTDTEDTIIDEIKRQIATRQI